MGCSSQGRSLEPASLWCHASCDRCWRRQVTWERSAASCLATYSLAPSDCKAVASSMGRQVSWGNCSTRTSTCLHSVDYLVVHQFYTTHYRASSKLACCWSCWRLAGPEGKEMESSELYLLRWVRLNFNLPEAMRSFAARSDSANSDYSHCRLIVKLLSDNGSTSLTRDSVIASC